NRTGASAGRRPHPAPSIRSPLRRRFRRGAIQPRIRVMGAILGTVLLLFAARLVQIQGFNADDYAEAAANLRLTTIEIPTVRGDITDMARSEEHTSELQSRENLVCRLLLEKKK